MIGTEQDRDALMETVELYGDLRERFGENPECEKLLTAIRAMLAPDDGVLESRRSALIRLMNMLTLNQVNALGEDDMVLIFGKVGEIHIEEHLRAYGKPGANPKMIVPEKRITFVSNTEPEATRDE